MMRASEEIQFTMFRRSTTFVQWASTHILSFSSVWSVGMRGRYGMLRLVVMAVTSWKGVCMHGGWGVVCSSITNRLFLPCRMLTLAWDLFPLTPRATRALTSLGRFPSCMSRYSLDAGVLRWTRGPSCYPSPHGCGQRWSLPLYCFPSLPFLSPLQSHKKTSA